jgi:hypothetical protein
MMRVTIQGVRAGTAGGKGEPENKKVTYNFFHRSALYHRTVVAVGSAKSDFGSSIEQAVKQ